MKDTSRKVYFARCIGPTGQPLGAYKIGCSYGFNDRIKSAAANLPFTLELVAVTTGSLVMEAICHQYLKAYRIRGEYFRECPETDAFIERVARTGEAFHYISDTGSDAAGSAVFTPLMIYHGVSNADIAKFLGRPVSAVEKLKAGSKSRNVVAAIAVIAANRGQYVRWPDDLIAAKDGKIYHTLRAAKDEAA